MKNMRNDFRSFVMMVCMTAAIMTGMTGLTAMAATKAVSSVSVRVGTDVEPGECLEENIEIIDDSLETRDGTYAATNSTKYYVRDAEWVTSTSSYMKVGQEPKMRLYLFIEDDDYAFKGTYSSSNVTVKGGTFVSAKRSSGELEVVVKLNGIKGQYPAPSDATWKDSGTGKAIWNQGIDDDDDDDYTKSITSGYYDVYLYRGSSVVKKLESYKGTSYNFYPYMTKAGTYSFKVRTVPYTDSEKKYGTKSDWVESDDFYLSSDEVSDGSGQVDYVGSETVSTDKVGWIQSGDNWYYKYPDGSFQKNSWLKVGGIWYLFDTDGRMLTGWQLKNGRYYYMQSNGAMYSGWIKSGDSWYFLNRVGDGDIEGAMRTGWLTFNGKTYYLTSSGAMAEGWTKVDNNWYYFYPGYGYKATNTTIDTFYVDSDGIWRK